jgi:hypothetical protein
LSVHVPLLIVATNNEFLLEASFYLEPIGCALPGAINTVLALRYYALHAFLFRKVKECLSFGVDVASNPSARSGTVSAKPKV